jgi:CheY-like chemotaxis protein
MRPSFEDENRYTLLLGQAYNPRVPFYFGAKGKAHLLVAKNPDILFTDHLTPSRSGYDAEERLHREPGDILLKNC